MELKAPDNCNCDKCDCTNCENCECKECDCCSNNLPPMKPPYNKLLLFVLIFIGCD